MRLQPLADECRKRQLDRIGQDKRQHALHQCRRQSRRGQTAVSDRIPHRAENVARQRPERTEQHPRSGGIPRSEHDHGHHPVFHPRQRVLRQFQSPSARQKGGNEMTQIVALFQAAIVFGTVILFGAAGEILAEKANASDDDDEEDA